MSSFYLGPNYGGGNEDNGDLLQKIPCMYCYTHCPQPCSRPPPTHASAGDSWTLPGKSGSVLLWGQCFFLLGPGAHKVLFVSSKSVFPQSCVSSGSSMVGLMVTSSKRAYAIPKSAAPRSLSLQQATADPSLHRRHSNTVLSLWGPWVLVSTRFVWTLWASLEWGLILNSNSSLLPSCWAFSFTLGWGVSPYSPTGK